MIRVGILGRRVDAQVKALEKALVEMGVEVRLADFHSFPKLNHATWCGDVSFDDVLRREPFSLAGVDVIHLRTTCYSELDPDDLPGDTVEVSAHHRHQRAKVAFQLSLAKHLSRNIPVVNPVDAKRLHRQKPFQHHLLMRNRVSTPRMMVTNDIEQARIFVGSLPQGAVAKPLASGAEVVRADAAFFAENARRIETRPFIFQQYVKGRAIRAYAFGGRVVSAGEIHYDKRYVDWRERTDRVEPIELGDALESEVQRVVRLLDLPVCGIDIEYDEYRSQNYFLDFNPSALFVFWSRAVGADIARSFAEYLVSVARTGNPWRD